MAPNLVSSIELLLASTPSVTGRSARARRSRSPSTRTFQLCCRQPTRRFSVKEIKREQRRRMATRFYFIDTLRRPTRAEIEEAHITMHAMAIEGDGASRRARGSQRKSTTWPIARLTLRPAVLVRVGGVVVHRSAPRVGPARALSEIHVYVGSNVLRTLIVRGAQARIAASAGVREQLPKRLVQTQGGWRRQPSNKVVGLLTHAKPDIDTEQAGVDASGREPLAVTTPE